jgi:hypothetical protein
MHNLHHNWLYMQSVHSTATVAYQGNIPLFASQVQQHVNLAQQTQQ